MSALPTRTDISGTPSKATSQAAFVAVYDYLKGLFGSDGVAGTARSALAVDGPTVVASVAASALTLALKTAAGADASAAVPLPIPFRSATLSNGAKNIRQAVAATSLVIPSTATLGATNAVDQLLYLYALDNAGTVELAISATNYGASFVANTVAIAAASNSASSIYSAVARAGVPLRQLAVLRSNQTVAGTWAAVPLEVAYPEPVTTGTRIQTFTASGSFIVPPGITRIYVSGISGGGGGGGAGGGAAGGVGAGGGGGGAGQAIQRQAYPVTPGASLVVTIGAGGAFGPSDGAGGLGTAGGVGGVSSIGGLFSLTAGGGGGGGSNAVTAAGGAGGGAGFPAGSAGADTGAGVYGSGQGGTGASSAFGGGGGNGKSGATGSAGGAAGGYGSGGGAGGGVITAGSGTGGPGGSGAAGFIAIEY